MAVFFFFFFIFFFFFLSIFPFRSFFLFFFLPPLHPSFIFLSTRHFLSSISFIILSSLLFPSNLFFLFPFTFCISFCLPFFLHFFLCSNFLSFLIEKYIHSLFPFFLSSFIFLSFSFSSSLSSFFPCLCCIPFLPDLEEEVTECTPRQNTKCRCKNGYYKDVIDSSTSQCLECSKCGHGEHQSEKCE